MSNLKCLKRANEGDNEAMRIGENLYTLLDATEDEVEAGTLCLNKWYVERKYKTQVCEPGRSSPYYDMRSEMQELSFEELIFNGGDCIGAYHDELVFLFDDEKTHFHQKYLGEMKISHDQGIAFYDYYYLHIR